MLDIGLDFMVLWGFTTQRALAVLTRFSEQATRSYRTVDRAGVGSINAAARCSVRLFCVVWSLKLIKYKNCM